MFYDSKELQNMLFCCIVNRRDRGLSYIDKQKRNDYIYNSVI